jgi:hypothetical protein
MKDGKSLKKETVQGIFDASTVPGANKWKAANFERVARNKGVASYAVTYTGGT